MFKKILTRIDSWFGPGEFSYRLMSRDNNWTHRKIWPPQDMWPDYGLLWVRFIGWLHKKFDYNIGYWAEQEEWCRAHANDEPAVQADSSDDDPCDDLYDDYDSDDLDDWDECDLWHGTYAEIGDYVSNGECGTGSKPKGGNVVGRILDSYHRIVCYKILCTEYSDDDGHKPVLRYFDYMSPMEITFYEEAGHISYVESFGYKLRWRPYRDGFMVGFVQMYYNKELKDWIYD